MDDDTTSATGSGAVPEGDAPRERRATNLELFLDLAFVFAVAQISVLLASNLTVTGVAKGALAAWLVWWLWSQFTWLGTAIDLDGQSTGRLLVLAAVPATLLMAVGIPGVYVSSGLQFGVAYLVVQLWALAVQGWGNWGAAETRAAWFRYAPVAAVAPSLVCLGALLGGRAQVIVWLLAAAVGVLSALLANRGSDDGSAAWRIDPSHFAERHSLFVIIALGEVLVASGVAASSGELTVPVGAAVVAAVSVACALWWSYFGFVAAAVEGALRRAVAGERAALARDVFSFGHFPLILGVALYALVAKHLVAHPSDPLATADLVVLWVSMLLFILGFMAMHWRIVRGVAPQRLVALALVTITIGALGPFLPGPVTVALVALILGGMQAQTVRRVRRIETDVSAER